MVPTSAGPIEVQTPQEVTRVDRPHVGWAIAKSLELHGIQRVFSVPGESYLALLDGLYGSSIHNVVCRQEGGAAYMADAYGRATGTVGVAMVTRGPGAANAFVGVHTAWQDGAPLVVFVGLVPTRDRYREAFQEFDPQAWFGTQTKRVLVIDAEERASEIVAEAFHAARAGRPGPVVVGVPEDVVAAGFSGDLCSPIPVADGAVSSDDLTAFRVALAAAARPMLLLGGERWDADAAARVQSFAERNAIPVLEEWHPAGRISESSAVHVGYIGFGAPQWAVQALEDADTVLAVGTTLNDVTTDSYRIRQRPDATTIVISPDAELRGHSGNISRHVVASPSAFADACGSLTVAADERRARWAARLRADFLATRNAICPPPSQPGFASMTRVVNRIAESVDNPLITLGAGNHGAWSALLGADRYPSQLGPRNGSMGYSIPAAVAAALAHPERWVLAIAGDGEFLMNGQELATAAQEGAAFLVVVMDNGQFGTIRAHQEKHYPDRVSGTQLVNPDFAALARAYGGHGETVQDDADIDGAVGRSVAAVTEGKVALIHVKVDPRILLP